jgi:hypothetical protein
MSLSSVRPYFRARLNEKGYKEHEDGFNTNNIPSTLLNKSYHISTPSISTIKQNQDIIEMNVLVEVRFFIKGYRRPSTAIDTAISEQESMLKSILSAANRTLGNIKNVSFSGSTIEPLGDTNDNSVLVTLSFDTLIMICPN